MNGKYPTFNEPPTPNRNPDTVERAQAVRTVARHATDANDLMTLMETLGLTPDDIQPEPPTTPTPTTELRAHAIQKRLKRGTTRIL